MAVAGGETLQSSDGVIKALFFSLELGDDFVDVHGSRRRLLSYIKSVPKY